MLAKQPEVALTTCDDEPIHIPGRIQPHGLLLVLSQPGLLIEQISANSTQYLAQAPQSLLGAPLSSLFKVSDHFLSQVANLDQNGTQSLLVEVAGRQFQAVMHVNSQERLIVELEDMDISDQSPASDQAELFQAMTRSVSKLENATSLAALYQQVVTEIRQLIGYDRVKLYKFDRDWHGHVVAESKSDHMPSYLDLHFPATDIPKQARALYVRNRARIIADVYAEPVGIYQFESDTDALDMSDAILRAVSPIHIEYLQNMQVGASMSISVLKDGELWGLIACHHKTAKLVPYHTRMMCKLLSLTLSTQLVAKENSQTENVRSQSRVLQERLLDLMLNAEDPMLALVERIEDLGKLFYSSGVAIWLNGALKLSGETPSAEQIKRLVSWLNVNQADPLFSTDRLSAHYAEAEPYIELVSGILSIRLSNVLDEYLIWFRPEQAQTVSWGGNPEKNVVETDDQQIRLSPRKSFEKWSTEVRGASAAWLPSDLEVATKLRANIVEVVLQRVRELEELNLRLEQSNLELDAFAYIASHDLKEPLRGISNYASILLRRYSEALGEDGQNKLSTMVRLTQRLDTLLDSLLHFSRVGRLELFLEEVDLNEIMPEVLEGLQDRLDAGQTELRIERPLPTIDCDRTQVAEVFSNLISNALKYNDKDVKVVEIGYIDAQLPLTLYVRDNGIGIPESYRKTVFQIFKRLHQRNAYGGGNGAGLTIVKRIVERHSGQIWVESEENQGSTFYFTLGSADES